MRFVLIILLMLAMPVQAEWLCTGKPSIKLSRIDLINAYSGQSVLVNGEWLIAIMFPSSDAATQVAFNSLGISAQAAERLAKSNGLVDRNIRLATTPTDMIFKLKDNAPAVGYGLVVVGDGIEKCY
jgi:hypothetical protein